MSFSEEFSLHPIPLTDYTKNSAYTSQTFTMEFFAKIINGFRLIDLYNLAMDNCFNLVRQCYHMENYRMGTYVLLDTSILGKKDLFHRILTCVNKIKTLIKALTL